MLFLQEEFFINVNFFLDFRMTISLIVGACKHRRLCLPTSSFSAHSLCQYAGHSAHSLCQRTHSRCTQLANIPRCSQSLRIRWWVSCEDACAAGRPWDMREFAVGHALLADRDPCHTGMPMANISFRSSCVRPGGR
jgi:hypothetical protein